MELNLTLEDLRGLDQYPGIAAQQSAHIALGGGRKIIHRDYHRKYAITSIILMFFYLCADRLALGSRYSRCRGRKAG